jgi:hypothetical protein
MKAESAVSCSSYSYCDAVDLGGTRYLVPRLGTRRLVLGTAAAAICSTSEHESQANCPTANDLDCCAQRSDGKRFLVPVDKKLTAFLEPSATAE